MRTEARRSSPTRRFLAQTESLQDGFRKLSRAATLKDLATQFAAVLDGVFPNTVTRVFHLTDRAGQWQPFQPAGPDTLVPPLPADRTVGSGFLDTSSRSIYAAQSLVDRTDVSVVLTRQRRGKGYSDTDLVSLRLFLHLFDNAYQSLQHRRKEKDLVFALNHRVVQLTSLIDTGIEVSKLHQQTSPHELALVRAAALTNASKGLVTVTGGKEGTEETFFPAGERTRTVHDPAHGISSDFSFGGRLYTFALFEKESRQGILPFEETDQLLLDALARQVHASLENRHLLKQELEKQKIDKEMSVAASIQERILPRALPAIEGYDIAGVSIPSKQVGGDYFDCIALPDGRYALVMADVAGKGMPAALLVSSLHAYLSAYLETQMSLSELARRLNNVIYRISTSERFVTAFIALLNPATGVVEAVNAGHNPVYWLKNGGPIEEIKASWVPLGMLDMEPNYQNERFVLGKGDGLFLYTDGIPEATNDQGQQYELATPLPEFLSRYRSVEAGGFISKLLDDVRTFLAETPANDDMTALYLVRR